MTRAVGTSPHCKTSKSRRPSHVRHIKLLCEYSQATLSPTWDLNLCTKNREELRIIGPCAALAYQCTKVLRSSCSVCRNEPWFTSMHTRNSVDCHTSRAHPTYPQFFILHPARKHSNIRPNFQAIHGSSALPPRLFSTSNQHSSAHPTDASKPPQLFSIFRLYVPTWQATNVKVCHAEDLTGWPNFQC